MQHLDHPDAGYQCLMPKEKTLVQESQLWTIFSLLHSALNVKEKGVITPSWDWAGGHCPLGEFTLAPGMGFMGPRQVHLFEWEALQLATSSVWDMAGTCDALVVKPM